MEARVSRDEAMRAAAEKMNAKPADIPGLWWVPGYPELTTNQLLYLLRQRALESGAGVFVVSGPSAALAEGEEPDVG